MTAGGSLFWHSEGESANRNHARASALEVDALYLLAVGRRRGVNR